MFAHVITPTARSAWRTVRGCLSASGVSGRRIPLDQAPLPEAHFTGIGLDSMNNASPGTPSAGR